MNRYVESAKEKNINVLNARIKFFDELAKLDRNSSELLCLGRMVVARKIYE